MINKHHYKAVPDRPGVPGFTYDAMDVCYSVCKGQNAGVVASYYYYSCRKKINDEAQKFYDDDNNKALWQQTKF